MLTRHSIHCAADKTAANAAAEDRYVFFDIETTGLKRDATILYLAGCGYYEEDAFHIVQWVNDDAVSEPAILTALRAFLSRKDAVLLTFNGRGFDIPYLNRHYALNEIPFFIEPSRVLDFCSFLKPFQLLYGLPRGRQKDWEQFLHISREDRFSGGELIAVYKQYLIDKKEDALSLLLMHNRDDILGMERLLPLLSYKAMADGQFTFEKTEPVSAGAFPGEKCLRAVCRLLHPLPRPIRIPPVSLTENGPMGAMDAEGTRLFLTLALTDGPLKYFYPDYQDYYYLPAEDRAVHKSVGCYVEKGYRKKARPQTCYVRKEGLFFPVCRQKTYMGLAIQREKYEDALNFYRENYGDKQVYIEKAELFEENETLIPFFLCDVMKGIIMAGTRRLS